jgi:hypothetical protein
LGADDKVLDANEQTLLDVVDKFASLPAKEKSTRFCVWVRHEQATTQEEREELPESSNLPTPFAGEKVVPGLAYEGWRSKLQSKDHLKETHKQVGVCMLQNLTTKKEPKHQFQGFVRCYLQDHGDNKTRGKKGKVSQYSDAEQAIIEQQMVEMKQLPLGTCFWIREFSLESDERNVTLYL